MLTIYQIKVPLAKTYGLKRASLFGSYARNEQDAKSDVDILVELATPMGFSKFTGLQLDLEDALHCPVDLYTPGGMDSEVLTEIQKEAILLYAQA
ncbi:nucleotidyltransferase family protein [Eubacterium aggregans]|uniref:nucleotidyltransferase family protein n=1 Tax=Eubacterium aggregans TaxID=81409 RepID=UPI003F39A94D